MGSSEIRNMKTIKEVKQERTEPACHIVMDLQNKAMFYCPSLTAARATGLPFVSVPHQMNYKAK